MENICRTRQPNYRLPPQMCGELSELILQTLWDSPYRFGCLKLRTRSGFTPSPHHQSPSHFQANCLNELCVVIHRSMGLALLANCELGLKGKRGQLENKIMQIHKALVETQRTLRPLLTTFLTKRDCPPTLGIGLVVREFIDPNSLPANLPKEIVIDESGINDMESQMDRLFRFYSSDGAVVPMTPAVQLMQALSNLAITTGEFADENALVANYNYQYGLFPPLPPAA